MTEPSAAEAEWLSATALAEHHGLTRSGARPSISAYCRQLWQRRHFIVTYARAQNSAQYTESRLGQIWQVLTPLLNAAVYYFIFGLLLKTNRGVDNFTAFLVTGVFIFNYTQRAVISGSGSVTSRIGLVRALHFPRAMLPLATTVMALQQLLASMLVLAVIILATGEPLTLAWLLLAPALALQTVFSTGLALIFARLTTQVRDLQQLLPFALRTLQYASGVFYSIDVFLKDAPSMARVVLEVNPAAVYIEIARDALLETQTTGWYVWPLAVAWALATFVIGLVFFWRAEERYGRG